LNKQDKLAQTDRKHRCKHTGDNGEDGRHLEKITKTGETDPGGTEARFVAPMSENAVTIELLCGDSKPSIKHL
jgi:hypothetical protein